MDTRGGQTFCRETSSACRALPALNPTYSQAIQANGFVFVAGQIGNVPGTGKLVSDDIAEQARQALDKPQQSSKRRFVPVQGRVFQPFSY
jgi:hypothetical protein